MNAGDEFETIDLKERRCDICHLEDGEPVIKCVLNDHYLRSLKGDSADKLRGLVEAHEVCLQKWLEVIEQDNAFTHSLQLATEHSQHLQQSEMGGDKKKLFRRFMNFLGRTNVADSEIDIDVVPHHSDSFCPENESFLRTSISSLDWSIDSVEVADMCEKSDINSGTECESGENTRQTELLWIKRSLDDFRTMSSDALLKHLEFLRKVIEEKSKDLIEALQLRDTLKQRTDAQKSLIEQLVSLQCKH